MVTWSAPLCSGRVNSNAAAIDAQPPPMTATSIGFRLPNCRFPWPGPHRIASRHLVQCYMLLHDEGKWVGAAASLVTPGEPLQVWCGKCLMHIVSAAADRTYAAGAR